MRANTAQHEIGILRRPKRSMKLAPTAAGIPNAMAVPRLMPSIASALVMPVALRIAGRKYETLPWPVLSPLAEGGQGAGAEQDAVEGSF